MSPGDTSLGGEGKHFPKTTWGMVSRLDPSHDSHRQGLEELCRRYWKPVYRYARIAWAKSNEDAKDLTQAFFVWLTEDKPLANFEPARGGFRGYLKVLLGRFIGHQQAALNRLKRGGGVKILSMDALDTAPDLAPEGASADPAAAFDRAWIVEMVDVAIDRVRRRLAASGQSDFFRVYEAHDLVPEEERPSYAELTARLKLTRDELRARLASVREKVRQEIRTELAELTSDDRELEEEWRALFGA